MNRIQTTRPGLRVLAAGLALAGLLATGVAMSQDGQAAPPDEPPNGNDMTAMLVNGLKATPGCLGVDLGGFESGRQSIFAWFENKAACKAWYYSRPHQAMMNMVTGDEELDPPLAHVEDDGPIMVIATITPSNQPEIDGFPMPISQISIELFRPLPGGAHVNGRLSPAELEVPHMRDYTPAGDAPDAP
ncbi:MAG: hypothetical protein AAF432_02440 [Planctomycetota bacterium]